jgi:hypothetical protein
MAGRGPIPKDSRLRQRRNRKAGAAAVAARTSARDGAEVPDLRERRCGCGGAPEPPARGSRPKRGRPPKPPAPCEACGGTGVRPWHPETLAWWKDVWTSEVSDRYIRVDRHGLYRLAEFVDAYWWSCDLGIPSKDKLAEIRLQQVPYGFNPGDRSRMHWEVEKPPAASEAEVDEPAPALDSRKVLRMLG